MDAKTRCKRRCQRIVCTVLQAKLSAEISNFISRDSDRRRSQTAETAAQRRAAILAVLDFTQILRPSMLHRRATLAGAPPSSAGAGTQLVHNSRLVAPCSRLEYHRPTATNLLRSLASASRQRQPQHAVQSRRKNRGVHAAPPQPSLPLLAMLRLLESKHTVFDCIELIHASPHQHTSPISRTRQAQGTRDAVCWNQLLRTRPSADLQGQREPSSRCGTCTRPRRRTRRRRCRCRTATRCTGARTATRAACQRCSSTAGPALDASPTTREL